MGKKKNKPAGLWKRFKTFFLVLICSFSLGALAFVLFLLPMSGQRAGNNTKTSGAQAESRQGHGEALIQQRISEQEPNFQYEENLRHDFEQELHEVDLALVQSLMLENIGLEAIAHQEVVQKKTESGAFHFQTLVLSLESSAKIAFLKRLRELLDQWTKYTVFSRSQSQATRWEIRIQDRLTHALLFQALPAAPRQTGKTRPKLALIIDDLGESLHQAEELHALFGAGVTLAVLPFCTHTRDIARFGQKTGIEIMLHLPLEPESYPEVNPGPGCLSVDMNTQKIHDAFQAAQEQVPGLVGVNNHMGSRFTADAGAMADLLATLREQDLFFIDSLTTPQSKGTSISARLGVPSLSRDIFIDNEQNVSAIVFQLHKAEQLAQKIGKAVAIGHPYPETLAALQQWSQQRNPSVQLTHISALLSESANQQKESP